MTGVQSVLFRSPYHWLYKHCLVPYSCECKRWMRIESVGGKAPLYTDKESQRGVKGQKQSDRQRQDTLGATCRVRVCVRVGLCSRVCVCGVFYIPGSETILPRAMSEQCFSLWRGSQRWYMCEGGGGAYRTNTQSTQTYIGELSNFRT